MVINKGYKVISQFDHLSKSSVNVSFLYSMMKSKSLKGLYLEVSI